jgi:hypothetical protein
LGEALQAYEASRTIAQRLAQQDPGNAEWQRDYAWVQKRIVEVRRKIKTK